MKASTIGLIVGVVLTTIVTNVYDRFTEERYLYTQCDEDKCVVSIDNLSKKSCYNLHEQTKNNLLNNTVRCTNLISGQLEE